MGMYTELHFNAELVGEVPLGVVETLAYMTGQSPSARPGSVPDHALFRSGRWTFMLRSDSYYFPLSVASSIDFDSLAKRHYLRARCNLKDYNNEIGQFLDWVMPYVEAGEECLGYYRYETDPHPTLIYKDKRIEASPRAAQARPTVVCLCGSTRFMDAFREANLRETLAGRIVLTVGCDTKSDADLFAGRTPESVADIKSDLDELHKRKIDLADEVLVLNVGGYIGDSTRSEIEYAQRHGKAIRYLQEAING